MKYTNVIISGTGSYIPTERVTNPDFSRSKFYDENNVAFEQPHEEIAQKFTAITGILERRYVTDDLHASDIAFFAAQKAIEDAKINAEDIDYIIVAHDFGDVIKDNHQSDMVPSIAARVKHLLQIENPSCVASDLIFGCPGWIQGVIHAHAFIRTGMAKKCLVIGAETLSRVIDFHDRDSMIYADGAGAAIIEAVDEDHQRGILSFKSASHTKNEAHYLFMGKSNIANADPKIRYLKMFGRKIYEFSLKHVPALIKDALDKVQMDLSSIDKIFIHQANEKMDQEIIKRLFRLYHQREVPPEVTPMSIQKLGNNSVATVPTLLDLVLKEHFGDHMVKPGDNVVFASVGAGMNINAIVYRF